MAVDEPDQCNVGTRTCVVVYVPFTQAYKLYVVALVLATAAVTIQENSLVSQTLSERLAGQTNEKS